MNLANVLRRATSHFPDHPAVVAPDGVVTFAQLDRAADRVAFSLHRAGIKRGDRVAVWLPKSIQALAALQGVLRVGAAYVPCNPLLPALQVAGIVRDSEARAVIASDENPDLNALNEAVRCCVLTSKQIDVMSDEYQRKENFPLADTQGYNCAYILYTSGSTGNPKGVCISHRAAFAFVEWAAKTINAGPEDRFANHAPLHFDLSVLDLYVAWSSGARVVLVPETVSFNPKSLIDLIIEERVTVWYSVPSALMLMMDYGGFFSASLGHLRAVLFAGEAFPIKYVRELRRRLRHIRIWNLYGPTETNVCTAYEVLNIEDERISAVPIGKAVCGNRVWAVDPLGSEIGSHQIGELMVAGPTVMLGYWGRETQGDRPYATGDLVRLLPDGNYEFIGRRDEMLKVRGYRIEPGQIESVLVTHPQVREAAVVAIGTGITAYLVAIMVTTWPLPRVLVLKRHCAESLPRHMIPHEFHFVRALPRTDNGKIHRRRLPKTLKDREQPKPSEQELGFSNTAV